MILTLQETKGFLHCDFDYDDGYITELIESSEDLIIDSIGVDEYAIKILNDRFKRKTKLCCKAMIQDCYDNRTLVTKDNEKIRYIIDTAMLQMKYCSYQ